MNANTVDKISDIRSRIYDDNRVSLSDFARGKEWRAKLAKDDFMELQDHGERMAWIVSEQGMREVVDYVSELERLIERTAIQAMFEEREGREEWKTGTDLEKAALSYLGEHGPDLLKAARDD